jgi:diketogulonate reductase-like aldo/keto reductase
MGGGVRFPLGWCLGSRWGVLGAVGVVVVTAADNAEYIAEDLDLYSFNLTASEMEKLRKL